MQEMRAAIETGTFQDFVKRFHADRGRGIDGDDALKTND
jgi:queuine/archaeosine tRNA-ribosyltransferase